jgi:hypothetical protein
MKLLAVASLTGALLAPALQAQACFDPILGTDLGLTHNSSADGLGLGFTFHFAGVAYTQVSVCSNGYLWFGAMSPSPPDFTPTLEELRDEGPRLAPLWAHFDPAAPGGGKVYFKSEPGRAVFTWAGVYEYGTTNPVDFQVSLFSTDHIDIAYGDNVPIGTIKTDRAVIGASQGGGALLNQVSFAARPFLTNDDSFGELFLLPGPWPTKGARLNWSPAFPGYAVSNVACAVNSLPPPAAYVPVGFGCPIEKVTAYEMFADAMSGNPVDLSGMTLAFQPNGMGGYVVTRYAGTSLLPPFALANDLYAGDDTTHRVSLPFAWPHATGAVTDIVVGANGFVTLGPVDPGPGADASSAVLCSGPPRIAAYWTDLDPSAQGSIMTAYEPRKGQFAVIWDAVGDRLGKITNSFAVVFEPSGAFRVELFDVSTFPPRPVLFGYSDGDGAFDKGMFDFSISKPVDLGVHRDPLVMEPVAGSLPQLGALFQTRVRGIAPTPNGHLAFLLLGSSIPPLDLGVLGATGCRAYLAVPEYASYVNVTFGAPSTDFPVMIPNAIDLAGVQLMAQAVSDDMTANSFGWRMSNGGRWTIGM